MDIVFDGGLCDELITRPEESSRMCVCLIVGELETQTVGRPSSELGGCAARISRQSLMNIEYS
jgi:hypothetical protein